MSDFEPVTRRFAEAIEFTLANDILQLARNCATRLIFYMHLQESDYSLPFAMIIKYDVDMNDDQFKVMTFGNESHDDWDSLEPIFPDITSCAKYIARHYFPDPDRWCIGTRFTHGRGIPRGSVRIDKLKNRSCAREWLLESQTMYANYLDELGDVDLDSRELQWDWIVSDEDHFMDLLENQIDFLAMVTFAGMDF